MIPNTPEYTNREMYCGLRSHRKYNAKPTKISETGIERVQALADILHSALCCHSNETCALIANPPNTAQQGGTPTIPPRCIRVPGVVWEYGEEQTHRRS